MSDVEARIGDVVAYVSTLDAPECIGELVHVGRVYATSHAHATTEAEVGRLARVMLAASIAITERLAALSTSTPPPHDGTLHSCTVIGRAMGAGWDPC